MKVLAVVLGLLSAVVVVLIKLGVLEVEQDRNGAVVARVNWNS